MTPEGPAAIPLAWVPARIEAIEVRTPRVKSFFLSAPVATALAGQHLDVRLTAPDGYQARRSYSIASAPGAKRIELAIERLDDGEVSPFFHDVAQVGDSIEVLGPVGGHFVWRPADGGPVLLVAGGSGVVPLFAMLRERAAAAPQTEMLLVHSARVWEEILFRDEGLAMAAQDARCRVRFATTREARRRSEDLDRRLDAPALATLLAAWGHMPRVAYVCGATAFVETMTAALVQAGLPAAQVRAERYGG